MALLRRHCSYVRRIASCVSGSEPREKLLNVKTYLAVHSCIVQPLLFIANISPLPHAVYHHIPIRLIFFFHFVSRIVFLSKYVVHVSTEHGHYTIYFIIRVASTPTAAVSTLLLDDKDHGIKIFDGFVPLTRFARSKHTA